jgi:ATP-dependent Clp protease ATP-binding subunit ClpA
VPDPEQRVAHLRGLEAFLASRVLEQDHVLPKVAGVFSRGELGFAESHRPKGSIFLTGPTGTGKSETFISAVNYVCGSDRLIPFDMSEYQDADAVKKFIGENRDDPGLLGAALRRHNRGAFFFDEIDKAHPPLLGLFLQILWDGRVTVATGETFTFENFYLGFASNLGGAESMRMDRSSFASVEQAVLRRVRQSLRPEFLARLDEIVVFRKLSAEAQRRICSLAVADHTASLRQRGFDVEISRDALEFLVREGFDPQLGARPLKKAVRHHIENALVHSLFARGARSGRLTFDPGRRALHLE